MQDRINNIDWLITTACESTLCPFCYSADDMDMFAYKLPLSEAMEICKEIKNKDIEYVTLFGGEPLLYPYIEDVVDRLHNDGVKTILNSGFISKKSIFDFIDKLFMVGLPIEGTLKETISQLRGQIAFDKAIEILEYLRNNPTDIKIKASTVLNKINISETEEIYKILKLYEDLIDGWRIYEFTNQGRGRKNCEKLSLAESEFDEKMLELSYIAEQEKPKFQIIGRSAEETDAYCLQMTPDGRFFKSSVKLDSPQLVNATIYDDASKIKKHYNIEINEKQKGWRKDL